MVNVQLTNSKLWERSVRIVRSIADCSREEAESALNESRDVRTAIVMVGTGSSVEESIDKLKNSALREILSSDVAD
jgi:N-acetylmuramic acid 6-phosphate (MurNAc-6-P) etherase